MVIVAKKERELKPKIKNIDIGKTNIPDLDKDTYILEGEDTGGDSYFKSIVNMLMDKTNPSTKTEYLNVKENFVGAKLSFLAIHGNIPYLQDFVNIFELKRISLERKGRKELIMSLVERQQELERQRDERLKQMFLG